MAKRRFKNLGLGSFFGSFVYERIVPRDHILVKLNQVIDWEAFVPFRLPAYDGLAQNGRPPSCPIAILKMLIITYFYKLSERQTENVVNFQLPAKEFVGLAVDEPAPDHSTVCLFKRRLREASRWDQLETVSEAVLRQARAAGITLGQIQVVDSVHTVADVDNDADRQHQELGQPPRDPQAALVQKGKRRVTQAVGRVESREIQDKGYKTRVSLNAETRFITTVYPKLGRAADNEQIPALLAHDEAQVVGATVNTGDMAYDDTDLHMRLWDLNGFSAFHLHTYHTQKQHAN